MDTDGRNSVPSRKDQREDITKQEKYNGLRRGIKNLYKNHRVTQINIALDFLGGYHVNLEKDLTQPTKNKKHTEYLAIKKSQKWIVAQNNEIVKKFYGYKN